MVKIVRIQVVVDPVSSNVVIICQLQYGHRLH